MRTFAAHILSLVVYIFVFAMVMTIDYTMPCAMIALATFMKPATLAPLT